MSPALRETDVSSGPTIEAVLHHAAKRLNAAGIESPWREARLLLAAAADLSPATILGWPERSLAGSAIAAFDTMLERRLRHEPLSRILGHRGFWTLDLAISPATLDPRPDTETIVEAALAHAGAIRRPSRILDLGTGTGAILLALLSELPNAWGLGVDVSLGALKVARRNATANGMAGRTCFVAADWTLPITGKFDLIVSNPPYISSGDIPFLAAEVRDHDPQLALDGGADGLDPYRRIIPALPPLLAPKGAVMVEIGSGQAQKVSDLFARAGFSIMEQRPDIAGIIRAVTALMP